MRLNFLVCHTALVALGCGTDPTSKVSNQQAYPPLETTPSETTPTDTGQTPTTKKDTGTPQTDTAVEKAEPETVPGIADGDLLFVNDVVHNISLTITDTSWSALTTSPREYATVTFETEGHELEVAIRLKGNTQYRELDDKPSLVIDFNRVHEDQTFHGLASVYLHNMTWDPSMMHEHLAYWYFRELGVPASRTAYARLRVNDQDYGLYLFVEKQNQVYRQRWWEDTSGSLYETGSFNHGCDLNDTSGAVACDCFEVDDVGKDTDALDAMCRVVASNEENWYEQVQAVVDMEMFLPGMAAEMLIAHFDNYGWNRNNFRIYHEPTLDLWYFTPWSTDLSFGWYPWVSAPRCGSYGQSIYEYQTGYLLQRCWTDVNCKADLWEAISLAADTFEKIDIPTEIDRLYALIAKDVYSDGRKYYENGKFEAEVDCAWNWADTRPDSIRSEL